MAEYSYKARNSYGALIEETIEASNLEQAENKLNSLGYIPIEIVEKKSKKKTSFFKKKVKLTDLILFYRQFATLIDAGLPIISSLNSVKNQTSNPMLEEIVEHVINSVQAGNSLHDAISDYPKVFTPLHTNMIKVAEEAGLLGEILDRLAIIVENEQDTRDRIKTATRYPKMVVFALGIAVFILMKFVVPTFADIFKNSPAQLPLPTRIMITANDIFQDWWILLIIGVFLLVFGFRKLIETEEGRRRWDLLRLRVYIFGPLFTKIAMSRFSRTLGLMIRSGVPIVQALEIVGGILENVILENTVTLITNAIVEGKSLAEPMDSSKFFPKMVVQMVSVGEETGRLDDMLLKVSDYYEKEIDYTIKNLATLLEPIILLGLAVIVTFLALAIFLPMWNIMQVFSH